MHTKILDLIIHLEIDLSQFYEKIKKLARLKESQAVLEFMETHSYAHSEMIKNTKNKLKDPAIRKELILNFHEKLKNTTFEKAVTNTDIQDVLTRLAGSEESVGKLYKTISKNMLEVSDFYRELAGIIDTIAEEEYHHRDLLMQECENIKKRMEIKDQQ